MNVRSWSPNRFLVLLSLIALIAVTAVARAQAPDGPQLHTNEDFVDEAAARSTLAVDDPLAVFAYVFAHLPERVKVFPTENYYYFSFIHNGVPYDGNIRLDASNRDDGKLNFAYSEDLTEWREEDTPVIYRLLDASQGVAVEKLDRLLYRVSFRGKSVVFALNDLSQVKPPPNAIGPDDQYIGPIFDESGIRFFLIYNKRAKVFHYILDETVQVADQFVRSRIADRILIGKRTGFAFYRDHHRDRKILVGAFASNIRINNYFDGPFDQLPDNFIEGDTLRDILIDLDRRLKGRIDRFGASPDGEQRYAITPYLPYERQSDLNVFDRCARRELHAASYYRCFDADIVRGRFRAPRRGIKRRSTQHLPPRPANPP